MVCMWTVISSYVVKNKKATQKKKNPQTNGCTKLFDLNSIEKN